MAPGTTFMNQTFIATVVSWIDGDSLKASLSLGLGITLVKNVRVFGIDTPEIHSTNPEEVVAAKKARDYAIALAPPDSLVSLVGCGEDKYGRILATVIGLDGKNIGDEQLAADNARPYFGNKKLPWPWPPKCSPP